MILQEKINKKAKGFLKFAPVLLIGADYALNNQWVNVDDDLPCNHKELIIKGSPYTKRVMVIEDGGYYFDLMVLSNNGKWKWLYSFHPTHWMPIPKMPKRNRKNYEYNKRIY